MHRGTDIESQDQSEAVLAVTDLSVDIRTRHTTLAVVDGVSFDLHRGEILGLVGESGSGKTMTSLAVMGVLPGASRIKPGASVKLHGDELVGRPQRYLESVRGREIAMVFQDAIRSLNPSFTIGDQIAETARAHLGLSRSAAWQRAVEMLDRVGIREPQRRAGQYPFEFSGGMAQRAMIAMALVCSPKVLIADEPTTALDVTVQSQILALLQDVQREMGLGILLVTHDLGVVAEMCNRVAVMYGGQIVEASDVGSVFAAPMHPYTEGLLLSVPRRGDRNAPFESIPGSVPSPANWPVGCRFHTRCPYVVADVCDVEGASSGPVGAHASRCMRVEELELRGVSSNVAS